MSDLELLVAELRKNLEVLDRIGAFLEKAIKSG